MMVSSIPMSSTPDYEAQFRESIQKSIEFVLARVEQVANTLPRDVEELALHALDFGLKLNEAWPVTRKVLLIMAPKMEQAGYRDEWMPFLELGIAQAQKHEDVEAEAELRLQLGILLRFRGQYDKALEQVETSERLAINAGQLQHLCRIGYQISFIHRLLHSYKRARTKLLQTLELAGSSDSDNAYCYLVLGAIDYDERDYQQAVLHYEESLRVWNDLGNKRFAAWCLTNISASLTAMKKHDEAIKPCQRAIILFEQINDPVHLAVARMIMGNIHLSLDDPSIALNFYQLAKQTFSQAHERLRLAHISHNIGLANRKLGLWSNAENAYLLSISRFREMGITDRVINSLDGLGQVYCSQGDHRKAVTTFRQAALLLPQISKEPSYKTLSNMLNKHLSNTIMLSEQTTNVNRD